MRQNRHCIKIHGFSWVSGQDRTDDFQKNMRIRTGSDLVFSNAGVWTGVGFSNLKEFRTGRQAKFLTCEISDFTPCAHAQSNLQINYAEKIVCRDRVWISVWKRNIISVCPVVFSGYCYSRTVVIPVLVGIWHLSQCSSTFLTVVQPQSCFDELMHPIYWHIPHVTRLIAPMFVNTLA